MAGIFPEGGVTSGAINMAQAPALIVDGCDARYHAPRCNPRFDPAAANAIIAEFLNLAKCRGIPWDCNALDNLCKITATHGISLNRFIPFQNLPQNLPNNPGAAFSTFQSGSFVIPNTFHKTIAVTMTFEFVGTIQQTNPGGFGDARITIHDLPDFSDSGPNFGFGYSNVQFEAGDGPAQYQSQQVRTRTFLIPPGGRTMYFRMQGRASVGGGVWRVVAGPDENPGLRYSAYGVFAETYDT